MVMNATDAWLMNQKILDEHKKIVEHMHLRSREKDCLREYFRWDWAGFDIYRSRVRGIEQRFDAVMARRSK